MKKNLVIAAYAVMLHVMLLAILIKPHLFKSTEELTHYYHELVSFQERVASNLDANSVLFIGDSLIQGLATSVIVEGAVNFGIGNDTTVGVLKRLAAYESVYQADFIVIAIGLNDFKYRDHQDILKNYRAILTKLATVKTVIVSAILPVDEHLFFHVKNDEINQFNSALAALTSHYSNTIYLDISNQLISHQADGNLAKKFHIGDGVHLNQSGNSLWISHLKDVIEQYRYFKN